MNTNDCRDVETLLGPYLDSELDAKTSLEVSLHLKACPACAARVAEEAAWQQKLKVALNEGPLAPGLWPPIEARVRSARPPTLVARVADAAAPARHWRYWLWPSPRLYAGLAAVWTLILGVQLSTRDPGPAGGAFTSESRTALIEQRHLLAELLGRGDAETEPAGGQAPPQTEVRGPGPNRAHFSSAVVQPIALA
ncbi:MAG: zf-HC2 domain-containing protein [Verrucomicrobiales bacterium]|nr:zf-HC2 domain-containing protein [Verrucomicrobiales bacterium]